MRERIKDTLVDQMMNIYGVKTDGWWTDPQTLNNVADAIIEALED